MSLAVTPLIQQSLLEHHLVQMSSFQVLHFRAQLLNDNVVAVQTDESATVSAWFQNAGTLECYVRTQRIHPHVVQVLPTAGYLAVMVVVRSGSVEGSVLESNVGIVLRNSLLNRETLCFNVCTFSNSSTLLLL